MERNPVIGVTMGDPAGVGGEIIVKALPIVENVADVVVIGDADAMEAAIALTGSPLTVRAFADMDDVTVGSNHVSVLDLDNVDAVNYGEVRKEYGEAVAEYDERAIDLVETDRIDAITSGPSHSRSKQLAENPGFHTLLRERELDGEYVSMLVHAELRAVYLSSHVPIREVRDHVQYDRLLNAITLADKWLPLVGVADPSIAVAGLNPHAGQGGTIGDVESAEIAPAVRAAKDRGIDVVGPLSPDTLFTRVLDGTYDCVIAMYHDQSHMTVKTIGYERTGGLCGATIKLGLPFVRTTVAHGPAFDLAGSNDATAGSMVEAIELASRAAERSRSLPG